VRWAVAVALCGCGRFGFDAGTSRDAADTTTDVTSDALDFCAANAQSMFCSDLSALGPWTLNTVLNASYEFADGTFHVTSSPVAAGDIAEADLIYSLPGTATRMTGSTDVRIDQLGTSDPVLLELRLTTTTSIHGVEWVYRAPPSLSYIEEFRDPRDGSAAVYDSTQIPSSVFGAGAWHRIEMMLDVGVTAPHFVASLDGTPLLDAPLLGNAGGAARVEIGLVYVAGPADAWDLRFDNVLAEAQ
jgi:hypothetical protein